MRIATLILAGSAAVTMLAPGALAQQGERGMITKIDRIHGTIAIQAQQSGTVGSSNSGPLQEFSVKDSRMLENLHAGDRVTFSATGSGGMKTITEIKK
ncbi:MAG: copper-binding protein [Bradyrhizobium sp.]|uniref:copper-binding protein n=1 Tax=Bradyrhizobium sp. TaxID=376 RepID=UPI0025C4371A|nr:copper-binding protein [Bradyrhizobium sp.]MBI5261377.1 copper-binding protein [Bradyrhizobium sp.]